MANETYTLIQKTTLNASAASITFSSIPQTFTDLVVKASLRDTRTSSGPGYIHLNFNGVSTNLSTRTLRNVDGSAASTTRTDDYVAFSAAIDGQTANTFGNFELYVPNYTSTSTYKSFSIDSTNETNAATPIAQDLIAGLWSSNSAITSLSLIAESTLFWKQYSSVSLYGVAKQGVNPVAGPKASGGDIITNDGTYWIHQFLNSGTFTPNQPLSTGYLVVAGGGGGGYGAYGQGGGGGGGGLRSTVTGTGGGGSLESALSVTAQSYTITVGAGGAGAGGSSSAGKSGTNSTYSSITSTGGGGGGTSAAGALRDGLAGGSGGGGGAQGTGVGSVGTGTTNQGFNGGSAPSSGSGGGGGGGGGGAGAIGSNGVAGSSGAGGAGGAGVATSITGSSVTRGGGGGGSSEGGSAGTGGAGGGGAGGSGLGGAGTAGTVNTGGGGGSAYASQGAGGSGIVIIRYAI